MYHSGHVHHYLRSWPLISGGVTDKNYKDPKGMIHIVNGVGGAIDTDSFENYPHEEYEAFRDDYGDCKPQCRRGYGRVTIDNATDLRYEQFDPQGGIVDSIRVVRRAGA